MLTTNQRLDQLAAAHVDFTKRGMLKGTLMESALAAGLYNLYFPLHIIDQVSQICRLVMKAN
jgi:hypothetical protein